MPVAPATRSRLEARPGWTSEFLDTGHRPLFAQRFKEFTEWERKVRGWPDGREMDCDVVGYRGGGRLDPWLASLATEFDTIVGAFVFDLSVDAHRIPVVFQGGTKQARLNFPLRLRRVAVSHKVLPGRNGPERITFIVAKEWDRVDPLQPYAGHGWTGAQVTKHFHTELDALIPLEVNTFLWSVLGAPALETTGGGVLVGAGMSPLGARESREFFADFQYAIPPPMRANRPRAQTSTGEFANGVALDLTTFVPPSNHDFDHPQVETKALGALNAELRSTAGEHSRYAGVMRPGASVRQGAVAMLQGAQQADLLYPFDLNENLPAIDLGRFLQDVDDRMYAAIAASHLQPIDTDVIYRRLEPTLQGVVQDMRESIEAHVGSLPQGYLDQAGGNRFVVGSALARAAAAHCRSRGGLAVEDGDLKAAAKQATKAFDALIERKEVRTQLASMIKQVDRSDQYVLLVRTMEREPGLSLTELWNRIQGGEDGEGKPLFASVDALNNWVELGRERAWWTRRNGRHYLP